MRRPQLISMLDTARAKHGSDDFTLVVPDAEWLSAATILRHLEAEGILSSWRRVTERPPYYIEVLGYTGEV